MRREVKTLVVVVLVIVAGIAGALVSYSLGGAHATRSDSQSSSTTEPPTNCTATFTSGISLQSGSNRTGFFLIPGTTGLVCVTYTVDTASMQNESTTIQFQGTVDLVSATYANNSGGGTSVRYGYSPAPGVTDTADPASFTFTKGSGMKAITVVYAITAARNSTGFYSLGYPENCPPLIPLAVTNEPKSVTGEDFPWAFEQLGCVDEQPLSDPLVTGLAAMNTTVLTP